MLINIKYTVFKGLREMPNRLVEGQPAALRHTCFHQEDH